MEARQKKAENLTTSRVAIGDSTEDNQAEQNGLAKKTVQMQLNMVSFAR